jgi:hypothetical protein
VALGDNASVVWTGKELIVWGGETDAHYGTLIGAGAAYDPKTNRWTVLRQAPITARTGQASVWTGTEMIVWGGYDGTGPSAVAVGDGAAYNPSTNTWRRVPTGPLPASANAQAVWTGHEAVVISTWANDGSPGTASTNQADVAAYDPSKNSWRSLPTIPSTRGHDLFEVQAVATGGRVVAFATWSHVEHPTPSVMTGTSGVDTYSLEPAAPAWIRLHSSADNSGRVTDPVSIGSQLIVTYETECLLCAGGAPSPTAPAPPTYRMDPVTGAYWALPRNPAQTGPNSASAWTGHLLLRVASGTAAWDPSSNTWTILPTPPTGSQTTRAFWTGHELLTWGHTGTRVGGYRYVP